VCCLCVSSLQTQEFTMKLELSATCIYQPFFFGVTDLLEYHNHNHNNNNKQTNSKSSPSPHYRVPILNVTAMKSKRRTVFLLQPPKFFGLLWRCTQEKVLMRGLHALQVLMKIWEGENQIKHTMQNLMCYKRQMRYLMFG